MPLTKKGRKVKSSMMRQYGKGRGERIFYASEKKGTVKDVAKSTRGRKSSPRHRKTTAR